MHNEQNTIINKETNKKKQEWTDQARAFNQKQILGPETNMAKYGAGSHITITIIIIIIIFYPGISSVISGHFSTDNPKILPVHFDMKGFWLMTGLGFLFCQTESWTGGSSSGGRGSWGATRWQKCFWWHCSYFSLPHFNKINACRKRSIRWMLFSSWKLTPLFSVSDVKIHHLLDCSCWTDFCMFPLVLWWISFGDELQLFQNKRPPCHHPNFYLSPRLLSYESQDLNRPNPKHW